MNLFTLSQHFIDIYLSVSSLNNSYNFFENINIKIVAREKGKLVELDRINKKLSSSIKHKEKISLEDRKAYIEDYIISMKSFAEKLKSRAK